MRHERQGLATCKNSIRWPQSLPWISGSTPPPTLWSNHTPVPLPGSSGGYRESNPTERAQRHPAVAYCDVLAIFQSRILEENRYSVRINSVILRSMTECDSPGVLCCRLLHNIPHAVHATVSRSLRRSLAILDSGGWISIYGGRLCRVTLAKTLGWRTRLCVIAEYPTSVCLTAQCDVSSSQLSSRNVCFNTDSKPYGLSRRVLTP